MATVRTVQGDIPADELGVTLIHEHLVVDVRPPTERAAGYPDDLDPFDQAFVPRFAELAYRFALWLRAQVDGPRFYVPLNEPSFFAWAGGDSGWFAPFLSGRGWELKLALVRAGLAATDALRAADPSARLIAVDPIIHAHAPLDAPEQAEAAARQTSRQYEVWDMLAGQLEPQLGGGPGYLDIVGVNYYLHSQYEYGNDRRLELDDPRRKPFREMLQDVYRRYGRPIVITETACCVELRPIWLRYIVDECLAALQAGVDLQGICLYPIIDFPGWDSGKMIEFGLWDLVPDGDALRRVVYEPYLEELRRSQARLETSGLLPVWTGPNVAAEPN